MKDKSDNSVYIYIIILFLFSFFDGIKYDCKLNDVETLNIEQGTQIRALKDAVTGLRVEIEGLKCQDGVIIESIETLGTETQVDIEELEEKHIRTIKVLERICG